MPTPRCTLAYALIPALALALARPVSAQPSTTPAAPDRVLHNGIRLPQTWPPRSDSLPRDPVAPPYLKSPPAVIPVDVGRQLLVDDFLIEQTTLKRTWHTAEYFAKNPVLKPDQPWEMTTPPNPTAMPFSDGVWFDPKDKLFKMWYMSGYTAGTCYATSADGIRWDKPKLNIVASPRGTPGSNLIQQGKRDSATVWLDHDAKDPKARFKIAVWTGGLLLLHTSPDGIHWGLPVKSGPTGDRTTFFYNPFLKRWVYSLRSDLRDFGRIRRYWEANDFLADAQWKSDEAVLWVGADSADPKRADLNTPPQLYNLDCAPYESLMLGLFTIWRGQPNDRAKPNEVCLGFSRDGFHFDRPDRRAFIAVSERQGDWNWGNVQSAGGGCLIVGDKLYFYVSGRAGIPGSPQSGVCSTGLATLRRDGFASMDAGKEEGTLTTRPIRFKGSRLFVNADVPDGELRVEVLDESGQAIAPFSRQACAPLKVNTTRAEIRWQGATDLSKLAGQTVRLRFHLRSGRLYAFWISPDESGASHGYVAAGGPGLDGAVDLVGRAAK